MVIPLVAGFFSDHLTYKIKVIIVREGQEEDFEIFPLCSNYTGSEILKDSLDSTKVDSERFPMDKGYIESAARKHKATSNQS